MGKICLKRAINLQRFFKPKRKTQDSRRKTDNPYLASEQSETPFLRMDNTATPETLRFPCHSCGAYLTYKPGTQHLTCSYCGADNTIEDSTQTIEELDFDRFLNNAIAAAEQQQVAVVKCTGCGAESSLKPGVTSDNCPFCGSALVVGSGSLCTQLKPKSVLPFQIDQKSAFGKFRDWLKGLWFAPGDLIKFADNQERLTGMYLPYWTYDCATDTAYTGQRGDYYYVTQLVTVNENGRNVQRQQQVRKTRWSYASGRVQNTFDDVLVEGTASLPQNYLRELQPWALEHLKPFDERYLSGFRTETYKVDVKQGFEEAKQIMDGTIRATVCRDIGGDEQQITSLNPNYNNITFKHVLLPVWLSAYRYNGKVYRFMINGWTGEVQGERPWSAWKIFLAVVFGIAAVLILLYLANNK